MGKPEAEREADMRSQHKEFLRVADDGHNRHSGITSMWDLGNRRDRRLWNFRMRETVKDLNNKRSLIWV